VLTKKRGEAAAAWWNKTTISVIGQENIVNFNKYDTDEVITGDYEQVLLQHFHGVKEGSSKEGKSGRRYGMALSLLPSEFEDQPSRIHFIWSHPIVSEFVTIGKLMMDEPTAELPEDTLFSLTLSMAYNMKKYDRKVYSVFDWLSATGGLLDIIERFFGIIVVFFSLRIFNVHMNERLFKVPASVDDKGNAVGLEHKTFESNCCRILCFEYCLKPFKCCCKERLEKNAMYKEGDLYERGVEKLERALDVEQLRKDHRLLLDMKFLMLDDPYLRKLLKI